MTRDRASQADLEIVWMRAEDEEIEIHGLHG
jgi:hypothetical protein